MTTNIDVKHIAWLARIHVSAKEEEMLKERIKAAMGIINKLLEAKVDNIEPLYHPQEGSTGRLRPDKALHSETSREKLLANAAKVENGFIVAPRTVEE